MLVSTVIAQDDHRSCGTVNHSEYLFQSDSSIYYTMQMIEENLKNTNPQQFENNKVIITIPVVVHVLYSISVQNISDAQINSQITALNKDYRKQNSDTINIPQIFKGLAADVGIEFCLAKRDPQGNPTTGITRTLSSKSVFDLSDDDAKFTSTGGHDIWDRSRYLNIWVVPAIKDGSTTGILGYAQMPGGPSSTDGVVIGFNYFGTTGVLSQSFNLGRTATHEVGHWFSLRHIWGDDGTSCTGSDFVDDTPNQADENYDCPNYPSSSCGNTSDMFNNYLDYSDDACMNMFTTGQKTKMLAAINLYRSSLLTSNGCTPVGINEVDIEKSITIYPNPTSSSISVCTVEGLEIEEYEVMDLTSKIYYSEKIDNNTTLVINTESLSRGIYILRLKTNNGFLIKKIIKE